MWIIIIGTTCMILVGAAGVAIGLYQSIWSYAILGGILVVVGVFVLISLRRSRAFFRNL